MNNLELLQQSGVLAKQFKPLDFGGYVAECAGQNFQVWVNPPGVFDDYVNASETRDMDRWRRIVSILFEIPLVEVNGMDDELVSWLFTEGISRYQEFHTELKKTSATS